MSGIVVQDLQKTFLSGTALHQIDLDIAEGELVTLLGPSGCGKTTTLRCVAGLETPTDGSIRIGGSVVVDVAGRKVVAPHKRNVGMVFQSYALWPHLTVGENVAYPLKRRRTPRGLLKDQVRDALAAVGMDGHSDRYAHELSGGQQQRVALARGLVSAGGVMLFDEPLSNLDAKLRLSMRSEIRRLHDKFGHTALYVTHDQGEALAIADRIVIMNRGRVEQQGPPREVYDQPRSRFVADFVGFENILTCTSVLDGGTSTTAVFDGGIRVPAAGSMACLTPGMQIAFRGRSVSPRSLDEPEVSFTGRVAERTYNGDSYVYAVDLPDGIRIAVEWSLDRRSSPPVVDVGGQMQLHVAVADVVVLAADEVQAEKL